MSLRAVLQVPVFLCAFAAPLAVCGMGAAAQSTTSALQEALRNTGGAGLVIDAHSGRVLGSTGNVDAMWAPGSVVKPFVLRAALQDGIVTERATVHCAGTLHIAGHNLACVHPRDVTILDARQALAESCNTYFAAVSRRFTPEHLTSALRSSGFTVRHAPATAEERELLGLGLVDLLTSVRMLTAAYRELAFWMGTESKAAHAVRDGLLASVDSGVAHAAQVDGLRIAGKTGTVDESGSGRSHGWFAGVVYGPDGQISRVLAVYIPNGNGRDAAAAAHRILERLR